jgi:Protein of unknown function (DUF2948)
MDLLKLVALDPEDLEIVSAHLQDAIVRVGDLAFLPEEGRFALVARRFDWEASPHEPPRRRLAGLHFERVTAVRARGIDRSRTDAAMSLLAIAFEETNTPSGTVSLIFAEGGAIQIEVECIEMQMKDLGPVWEAESRPQHESETALPAERR